MKSNNIDRPRICALYARAPQSQPSSIHSQLEACRAAAVKYGWTVDEGHVYVDDCGTGTRGVESYPQFAVLMAAASQNRPFDRLFVERLDRLSRTIASSQRIITALALWGVTIHVVDPPLDTCKDGAAIILNILDAIEDAIRNDQLHEEIE